jgi:hypothetical protein
LEQIKYDESGKFVLKDIYNENSPVHYFSELAELDYQIPQNAKPVFQKLIASKRMLEGKRALKIIDIGCSYGVNGALLKHGLSMKELYRLYDAGLNDDATLLFARDQVLYAEPVDTDLEMVGIDTAPYAIEYAVRSGLLDAGFTTNLEKQDPTPRDVRAIKDAGLIISTGCIGYVTEKSLERLLNASGGSHPWMAHFVLRMFDFQDSKNMLHTHGYATEKLRGLFRQRRFVSDIEQQNVLDNLSTMGIDPTGAELDGWYMAELFVSRPQGLVQAMPLEQLLRPVVH